MYDVFIHRKVIESLKDAPVGILDKFDRTVEILKINPIPWRECDVKKIEGEEDTYRIRMGDLRIIYSLEKKEKRIYILRIGKRGKIYGK